jgi:hypothetical protein
MHTSKQAYILLVLLEGVEEGMLEGDLVRVAHAETVAKVLVEAPRKHLARYFRLAECCNIGEGVSRKRGTQLRPRNGVEVAVEKNQSRAETQTHRRRSG